MVDGRQPAEKPRGSEGGAGKPRSPPTLHTVIIHSAGHPAQQLECAESWTDTASSKDQQPSSRQPDLGPEMNSCPVNYPRPSEVTQIK